MSPDLAVHRVCLHPDKVLGWLAHCKCGEWGSYAGWASQRQAVEQWKLHRDGHLELEPSAKPWTCERLTA